VEDGIKIDTAMAMVKQVDPDAAEATWRPYIQKALARKGGYDHLMKGLNECLANTKSLEYSPDGTPAFV
jgi:hypothetical protein